MTSRIFAIGALVFFSASGLGVIACTSDTTTDDGTGESEDDIKKRGAGLNAACDESRKCKAGLLCKKKSSGPPAGAVGLPLPSSSSGSGGPPPGAVGMPARPEMTCQNPGPGEEGGSCSASVPCQAGLECKYAASTSGGMPPGAMGMPVPRQGTCEKKSSGPPPGAVGLPLPPGG